jgi:hypothetical protein
LIGCAGELSSLVKVKRKKMLARLKSGTINIVVCSDALGKLIKNLRFSTLCFVKNVREHLPERAVANAFCEGGGGDG